ncbi:unnamed protein product [Polarella glacialis]|uniref:Poly [ADP-ribose] polymerase n=1 Tax=Polarella glacialis TaxID=89957 RepID=A0A813K7S7_POLGL|nr:unnamed protein product [Polarella glacialis]CAE8694866.1 unnamed protein product [Polarella glacialis]
MAAGRSAAFALAALGAFLSAERAHGESGLASCPCLEWAGLDSHLVGNHIVYKPIGSGVSYNWPANYGNGACQTHDAGLAPVCGQGAPATRRLASFPSWCTDQWCWVSKNNCQGTNFMRSVLFPSVPDLYFSYTTCGSIDSFSAWAAGNAGSSSVNLVVESYLQSSRLQIEDAYQKNAGSVSLECIYTEQCICKDCVQNSAWGQELNAAEVGTWLKPGTGTEGQRLASCMTKAVADTFRRVAAKESDAQTSRVGYQYFADQASGSMIQWPLADWCPATGFDPRFRPWYAAGATGPKDIVVVVDVSGSMSSSNRHQKSRQAAEAILNTLVWKDFATIILFNHDISSVYSDVLVPVTNTNRESMLKWLGEQNWMLGSTNFKLPIEKVFTVIEASVTAGKTSTCQRAVMFLTDGEADFDEADYLLAQQKSSEWDIAWFTYALGTGAKKEVTKRLACDNKGIFYPVPDTADLTEIMAAYYAYFAVGQASCSPSFSRYADANTAEILYAGCLPMLERTASKSSLLGVACMDINMLSSIDQLKAQPDQAWEQLACEMSDVTKKCRHMHLTDCSLQKLRLQVSTESMCGDSANAASVQTQKCPCLDRNCQDEESFLDEKGYFCDAWIGDDCSKAATEKWGYSQSGQAMLMQKCKLSCGLCELKDPCPYTDTEQCSSSTLGGRGTCRACQSKVSGVGIDDRDMCCPGKAGTYAPKCGEATPSTTPTSGGPSPSPYIVDTANTVIHTGTLTLSISNVAAQFVQDATAKQAVAKGIAQTAGVLEDKVEITSFSQSSRLLRELPVERRLADGNVVVQFLIRGSSAQEANVRQNLQATNTLQANIATEVQKNFFYTLMVSSLVEGSPSDSSDAPGSAEDSTGIGMVIGILAGCLVGVAALVLAIWFFFFRRTKKTPVTSVASAAAPKATPIPPVMAAAPTPIPPVMCPPPAQRLAVPSTWKNQDRTKEFYSLEPEPALLADVQHMLDATWKKVKTRDRRDGGEPKRMVATGVRRVENNVLFQRYLSEVNRIKDKRSHPCTALDRLRGGSPSTVSSGGSNITGGRLDNRVNETVLWHGTSPQGAVGIAQNGFDLSRAGSAAGSMYGPGIYLAEASSKSDEYAQDDQGGLYSGEYCLILCKAVLGEPMCLTAGGDSVHALVKASMDGGAYDSVLGDREASVGTYREFVVYREEQVYPEFIVLYKRAD